MRVLFALGLVIGLAAGCGESPVAEQPALTNSQAAAMVTAETKPVAFNVEGAPTIAFIVPEMMCEESCVPQVRKILASQPGVKDVAVDLESKRATVAVDQDDFDAEKAIAALVDMRFAKAKLATGESKTVEN